MTDTKEARRVIIKLSQVIEGIEAKASLVGINTLRGLMQRRIFNEGKKADGSAIGSYSMKVMYLNVGSFSKANPLLGSGVAAGLGTALARQKRFKNGKARKTLKLEKGYYQLRTLAKRQNSYVDTELTGELRDSIITGSFGRRAVLGFLNNRNVKKAGYLEDKFNGDIYNPSESEIQLTINVVLDLIEKEVAKELNSI